MSDLVRKEIHGVYGTKNSTREQIKEYKRRGKELNNKLSAIFCYICSDLMSRMIKN